MPAGVRRALTGCAWLAAGVLLGCSSTEQTLRPAQDARLVAGMDNAAFAASDGVQIIAQTSAWPGNAPITAKVTPVHVKITNDGALPIRVQYQDFALVASDDKRFVAIPPLQTEGVVRQHVIGPIAPRFTHSGFMVAPYYAYAYPGIAAYAGPFPYDDVYYDTHYDYWADVQLPTAEMVAWALPDGVLDHGGTLDGYLYFQNIPDSEHQVQFRAQLMTAPALQPQVATGGVAAPSESSQAKSQEQKSTPVSAPPVSETKTITILIPFAFK